MKIKVPEIRLSFKNFELMPDASCLPDIPKYSNYMTSGGVKIDEDIDGLNTSKSCCFVKKLRFLCDQKQDEEKSKLECFGSFNKNQDFNRNINPKFNGGKMDPFIESSIPSKVSQTPVLVSRKRKF